MAGLEYGSRYDDGFVVATGHHNELAAHQQVQIRRLYRDGKSYRAIQQIMGISSKTVAKYLLPITRGKLIVDELA